MIIQANKRLLDGRCPQSPRTFLNENSCVPRADCSPPVFDGGFNLNAENLREFYTIDGKYVYRIPEMLTYKNSKSLGFQIERNGAELYPDENFSREIMQLFTIGLYMLNIDGTRILDDQGEPILSYSNSDIMNFARGFTNFARQDDVRDNIEPEWDTAYLPNAIDPMYLPTSEGRVSICRINNGGLFPIQL